jgi:hypothetical protein
MQAMRRALAKNSRRPCHRQKFHRQNPARLALSQCLRQNHIQCQECLAFRQEQARHLRSRLARLRQEALCRSSCQDSCLESRQESLQFLVLCLALHLCLE